MVWIRLSCICYESSSRNMNRGRDYAINDIFIWEYGVYWANINPSIYSLYCIDLLERIWKLRRNLLSALSATAQKMSFPSSLEGPTSDSLTRHSREKSSSRVVNLAKSPTTARIATKSSLLKLLTSDHELSERNNANIIHFSFICLVRSNFFEDSLIPPSLCFFFIPKIKDFWAFIKIVVP